MFPLAKKISLLNLLAIPLKLGLFIKEKTKNLEMLSNTIALPKEKWVRGSKSFQMLSIYRQRLFGNSTIPS